MDNFDLITLVVGKLREDLWVAGTWPADPAISAFPGRSLQRVVGFFLLLFAMHKLGCLAPKVFTISHVGAELPAASPEGVGSERQGLQPFTSLKVALNRM